VSAAERRCWTPADVIDLCKTRVRIDVPTAGEIILGCGSAAAYKSVKTGNFPVAVIRVGREMFVPTAHIVRLLGLTSDMAEDGDSLTGPDSPPMSAADPPRRPGRDAA
jgi:hypothetical protein